MINLPQLSEQDIADNSTDQSFQRGLDYYQRGAVQSLVKRGDLITAHVQGSYFYNVYIGLQRNEIISTDCSCPYAYGGWCKHIVATLLSIVRSPQTVDEQPSLGELLEGLGEAQLFEIMAELVAVDPEIINKIEQILHRKYKSHIRAKTKKSTTTIDPNYYRRQVQNAIAKTERIVDKYWDGEDDSDLPCNDILDLVNEVQEMGLGDSVNEAIAALSVITETCVEQWQRLYDYGVYGYEIHAQIDELWAELILAANLPKPERKKLSASLNTWHKNSESGYKLAVLAIAEQWDSPVFKKVFANPTQTVTLTPEEQKSLNTPVLEVRLGLLKKQERYAEYLALAAAAGEIVCYLQMLTALDRIGEVMANASKIQDRGQALHVAKGLVQVGALAEAITIAGIGLTLPGESYHQYELLKLRAELAKNTGQQELYFTSLLQAVKVHPRFADFKELMTISGSDWPTIKDELFKHLLSFKSNDFWGVTEERIKIFLAGDYVEGAIRLAPELNNRNHHLLCQVMAAALPVQPEWVIENAIPHAEAIMNATQAKFYPQAAELLALAKKGYAATNQLPQWQEYLRQFKTTHSRKRSLMPLLKAL